MVPSPRGVGTQRLDGARRARCVLSHSAAPRCAALPVGLRDRWARRHAWCRAPHLTVTLRRGPGPETGALPLLSLAAPPVLRRAYLPHDDHAPDRVGSAAGRRVR